MSAPEPLAELVAAADLTIAAGTARLHFQVDFKSTAWSRVVDLLSEVDIDPPPTKFAGRALSLVGRGVKAAEQRVSQELTGPTQGAIDFRSGACLLNVSAFGLNREKYLYPGGRLWRDRAGRWREKLGVTDEGSDTYSPMWLVELGRGATQVEFVGTDKIDGVVCRHLRATIDLAVAAEHATHPMCVRTRGTGEAIAAPEYDGWLDGDGRFRRIKARRSEPSGDPSVSGLLDATYVLTLSEFGAPAPLQTPELNETGYVASIGKLNRAFVNTWVERVREVLPPDEFTVTAHGLSLRMRALKQRGISGGSNAPLMQLGLPGPAAQKLQRLYSTHAQALQQFVSSARESPWPGPEPQTHVEIDDKEIRVWWTSGADSNSTVRLRPIARDELPI